MAKNDQKRVEIFWGASHMINDNIFNIFNFSTFSLGYFLDPVSRAIFLKFSQNAGFVKYPREKVEHLITTAAHFITELCGRERTECVTLALWKH